MRCEALEHVEGCNGVGQTRDHFTPKVIGRVWGVNIRKQENYQWLSKACHVAKDKSTALRASVLKEQLQGRDISFVQHQRIFL